MITERRPERPVDRSETSKWRRAVAKCAPLSTALFGVGSKWLQIRSDFGSTAAFEGSQGCSVGTDISTDSHDARASMARPRRLLGSSEVRVKCPPLAGACRAHILGTFKAVRVDLKLFYRSVLLHPASQLYCGAGGAFGPSGGANGVMVTRDHRSVPFLDV